MDIKGERIFKILIGMLLGPKDFPGFKSEMASTTLEGAEGVIQKELQTLLDMKAVGDLWVLGIALVIL